MDWLQFLSSIIASVAWPAAVVAVAYIAKLVLDSTDVGKTQPQEEDK